MYARPIPSAKTSASDELSEASARLWAMLKNSLQASVPAQTRRVEPPDRLPLSLQGRCLVPDGIHFVCEAVAVSARGLTVACEAAADPGDAVVANFRDLGEIAGVVESRGDAGFVMDIRESPERLATLSQRFLWSIRRQTEGAAERRVSARIDQKLRKALLKTKDGRETVGEVLDLSATGAAVKLGAAAPYFWVGQEVWLDNRSGRVRRHFPNGVGVEFNDECEVEFSDGQSGERAPTFAG